MTDEHSMLITILESDKAERHLNKEAIDRFKAMDKNNLSPMEQATIRRTYLSLFGGRK